MKNALSENTVIIIFYISTRALIIEEKYRRMIEMLAGYQGTRGSRHAMFLLRHQAPLVVDQDKEIYC